MLLLMPVLQRPFSIGVIFHYSPKNPPSRPDPTPAPHQDHLPEQRLTKLQPVEPRHVAAGVASLKVNGVAHGPSLLHPHPEVQFPF